MQTINRVFFYLSLIATAVLIRGLIVGETSFSILEISLLNNAFSYYLGFIKKYPKSKKKK